MNPETFWHAISVACFFLCGTLLGITLYLLVQLFVEDVAQWMKERRERRVTRIEAELDAKSEQLRRTILSLAEQLVAERSEAARQMTRHAFLTSRRTPPPN